jgi:hypothetical protein
MSSHAHMRGKVWPTFTAERVVDFLAGAGG